eukprot:m.152571 g.152571  ORF g.152571 m.152571 type:complete len:333 (-) comp16919_c1_seq3:120-1118(-)
MSVALVARLEGHSDAVWSCAWNPSGTLLATTGADKTIRIWAQERSAWVMKASLDGPHKNTIRSVSWSPCGNFLASASFDSTTCVWDKRSGEFECVATLEGHENEVKSCAWAPQGSLLATCGRDKSVWVWEANDDDEYDVLAVLNEHTQDVKSVVWHPTKSMLVSCSYDDTLKLYEEDDEEWTCIDTLTGHGSTVWNATFHASGDLLASCSSDKNIIVWKAFAPNNQLGIATDGKHPKWKQVCTLSGYHTRPIYSVDWSKSTNLLASAGGDNSICIFEQGEAADSSGAESFRLVTKQSQAHARDVNCVAWHPNGTLLASVGDDDLVCIWSISR